jgi:hypothetical protein
LKVRPLTSHDAERLLPLLTLLGWGTDRDRAAERIARRLAHPDHHGWVALDPTPLRFATGQHNWMLQVDAPVAELTGLAVLPDATGRRGLTPADRVQNLGRRRRRLTAHDHLRHPPARRAHLLRTARVHTQWHPPPQARPRPAPAPDERPFLPWRPRGASTDLGPVVRSAPIARQLEARQRPPREHRHFGPAPHLSLSQARRQGPRGGGLQQTVLPRAVGVQACLRRAWAFGRHDPVTSRPCTAVGSGEHHSPVAERRGW